MAAGGVSVMELYEEARQKGLPCSRTGFYRMLQSPVYAGLIVVSADKEVDRRTVLGQHTGLVSVETFNAVQKLFHKGRNGGMGRRFNPLFAFKGYLCCPLCHKILTASASKGRWGIKYYYYHCVSPCGFRVRCDQVNSSFNAFVSQLRPAPQYEQLCRQCVESLTERKGQLLHNSLVKKARKVEVFTNRLQTILSMLQDHSFNFQDYLLMKIDLEEKIRLMAQSIRLEQELVSQLATGTERTIHLLGHLDDLYQGLTDEDKPPFLAWLLEKGAGWPLEDWGSIMRRPPQVMYGRYKRVEADHDADLTILAQLSCISLAELLHKEMEETLEIIF
jgi:hypothetical protein